MQNLKNGGQIKKYHHQLNFNIADKREGAYHSARGLKRSHLINSLFHFHSINSVES